MQPFVLPENRAPFACPSTGSPVTCNKRFFLKVILKISEITEICVYSIHRVGLTRNACNFVPPHCCEVAFFMP